MRRGTEPLLISVLALIVFAASATGLWAVPQYRLTPLGFLGDGTYSDARSINDFAQVAGYSQNPAVQPGYARAFIWDAAGGMRSVAPVNGTNASVALGLNRQGIVVGDSSVPGCQGFRWTQATGSHPIANSVDAWALNDNGDVVGTSTAQHAAIWNNAGWMLDIGTLGTGDSSHGKSISNTGWVVGESTISAGGYTYHPFVWDVTGGLRQIGNQPGSAVDINDSGIAVGWVDKAGGGYSAMAWDMTTGSSVNLGSGVAYAVNNSGQVVGRTDTSLASVWTEEAGMTDLNTLLDATGLGWRLRSANDINSTGQIVGHGVNPAGYTEAFLLSPIPEPASLLALLTGLAGVGCVLRRGRR